MHNTGILVQYMYYIHQDKYTIPRINGSRVLNVSLFIFCEKETYVLNTGKVHTHTHKVTT